MEKVCHVPKHNVVLEPAITTTQATLTPKISEIPGVTVPIISKPVTLSTPGALITFTSSTVTVSKTTTQIPITVPTKGRTQYLFKLFS